MSEVVSQWRGLGRALLALLIRDVALKAGRGAPAEIPARFLDDPLLQQELDDGFFETLRDDAGSRYVHVNARSGLAHATMGCTLAREHRSERWREFLPLIFVAASRCGATDEMRRWAALGLEEPGDAASRTACHDALARSFYDEGRFPAALPEFEKAIEAAREAGDRFREWDAMTNIVACRQNMKDQYGALDWIDEAERIARAIDDPKALAKTLTDRGNAEQAIGNYEEAQRAYREAVVAAERAGDKLLQTNVLGNIGNVAYRTGDASTAEEHHRRALAISIEIGDRESEQLDHFNLGQALFMMGRSDEGIEQLREALRLARERNDPRAEPYRDALRQHLVDAGDLTAARALDAGDDEPDAAQEADAAPEVLERDPRPDLDPAAEEALRNGDPAGAEKLVRARLEQSPEDWSAWFHLGVVLSRLDRDRDAIDAYERALACNPNAAHAVFNMINAYRRLGDLETPLARFRAAVRDDPFDAMARAGVGRISAFLGRRDDAIRELSMSVQLRPGSSVPRLALAQTLVAKAREMLRTEFDRAGAVFEQASAVFDALLHDFSDDGELYSYAAMAFMDFAIASHSVNPPLTLDGMAAEDLVLLGRAAAWFDRAIELLGEAPLLTDGRSRALLAAFQLGGPRQLAIAARSLEAAGEWKMAQLFASAMQREDESDE